MRGRFDGFHAVPASVSKTCLVRFDNNRYSVQRERRRPAGRDPRLCRSHRHAPGRAGRRRACAAAFGRGQTIYDPWHYVPVLARKPGALRNGAPFKDWVLPAALERVRRKLAGSDDGDRQMVDILAAVLTDGLPAVEAACAEALRRGRPLGRRHPQHPGAAARPGPAPPIHHHADALQPAPCAGRRLRPLRQPEERLMMERSEILDMMGELKLYGMRAAYDEIDRDRA